ncbi:MAG: hypothetical protein ACJAZ2_002252, partial [Glaciecola sp.]
MKKLLVLFLVLSQASYGKFIFSAQGFYSQPLFKFEQQNFCSGYGLELGLGYQFPIDIDLMFEINGHAQFGENGDKATTLPIGTYILSNDFTSAHFEIKLRKSYEVMEPYLGVHMGSSLYHSDEFLSYNVANSEKKETYKDEIFSRNIFQYGASIGTYIKVAPDFYFDFGASLNAGGESINFIDLSSITYKDEVLDYKENATVPVMLLFNAGIIIRLHANEVDSFDNWEKDSVEEHDIQYDDDQYDEPTSTPTKEKPRDHSNHQEDVEQKDDTPKKLIKKGKT